MAKNKYVKEEEVVETPTIIPEEKEIIEEIKLVNLDKIINADTKSILSTVSDKAIKETFILLGKDKLDYIET